MESQFNQQSDWLERTEKLRDTEAAQINGGFDLLSFAEQSGQELDKTAQAIKSTDASTIEGQVQLTLLSQQFKQQSNAFDTTVKNIGDSQTAIARKS